MSRLRIVTFGELQLRFSKPGQLRLTQGDVFISLFPGDFSLSTEEEIRALMEHRFNAHTLYKTIE